ncbi:MAG: serine hydrolase domain-containing protein [Acidobacteriota bacterium]
MRLLAALLFFAICIFAAGPASATLPTEAEDAIRVFDQWAAAKASEREQPGLSIGIVRDQELVFAKGYGYADLNNRMPATPQTLYRVASITKLFTATSTMQLRDAGKLRLDDPVAKYLDWFHLNSTKGDVPIQVWHLMTHLSGLPRESATPYWNTKEFPTREQVRTLLAAQDAAYPPATKWKYSNLAVAIEGEVVAKVSGMEWADYVTARILKPLGMTASLPLPRANSFGLATGYGAREAGKERDPEEFTDCKGIAPAASLATNVEDLARFLSFQFKGDPRVLKLSTLEEMRRPQWVQPTWASGWGLGFSLRKLGSRTLAGHGGSLGGYRTSIAFDAEAKIGVIVLTNSNDGNPELYVDKAFQMVAPALAPEKEKFPAKPEWDKYRGTYRWKTSELIIDVIDGELVGYAPDAEDPLESRVRLEPAGEHRFRMLTGSSLGELAVFDVDASGRVNKVTVGGYYYLRK